jgi:Domain of unknown function (DUF4124)
MVRDGFGHIFRWRSILKNARTIILLMFGGACLVVTTDGARAAIFKCQGDGGIPSYQEVPCPAGKELRDFQADPPPLTIIPGASSNPPAPTTPRTEKSAPVKATASKNAAGARKTRGDPAERRHAHVGMSEGEVLAKLGRPDITAGGARKGKGRWTYLPAPGDPETITTLQIDRGVVTDVERKLVKR